jgi:hypothetical protein
MRKRRTYLVAALALAGVVAFTGVVTASPVQNVPHITAAVDKTKVPKKKYKKNGITFSTHETRPGCPDSTPTPTGCRVDPAAAVNISFDKDVKFNPSSEPDQCDPAELENQPTDQALQRCGDALIGEGSATAIVGDADTPSCPGCPLDLNADALVFNGTSPTSGPGAGKPGIVLFTRTAVPIPITTVLPSYIGKTPKSLAKRGKVAGGQTLFVTVPSLAGGVGSLGGFSAHVKSGKYVTTRCKAKNKTWEFSGQFTYSTIPTGGGAAGPPEYTKSTTTSEKCKPK